MLEAMSEGFPRPNLPHPHPGPHYNPMFSHMMGKFWGLLSPPSMLGGSPNSILSPPNPILSPPNSEGGPDEHPYSGGKYSNIIFSPKSMFF
jgi:hypothetical protein